MAHTQIKTPPIPWANLNLPPFPQIAIQIMQMASGREASILEISRLISSDPAFSREVITIANCPLYSRRVAVTGVMQAIALLGTENLKGLCLTVGVRAYLGENMHNATIRAIWRHSLASALIAEDLARAGSIDKDAAYSAGLLHDMGRLALAVLRPREYATLLETHIGSSHSILDPERELFGCNHCEAGRHLINDWKLPESFAPIVANHHDLNRQEKWALPALVHLSCQMADTLGFPVFPGCEAAEYAVLLAQLPVRERQHCPTEVADLAISVASKVNAIERG